VARAAHPRKDARALQCRIDELERELESARSARSLVENTPAANDAAPRSQPLARQVLDAIEAMVPGFALYDAHERLVLCNRAYTENFGRDLADVVVPGARFEDIVQALIERRHGSKSEIEKQVYRAGVERRHRELPSTFDFCLADGRWVRQRKFRTADGGVAVVYIEITELKTQEEAAREAGERHRRLLERIPDAVLIHTATRIVYANAAAVTLYRAASVDGLVGRDIIDIVHPESRGALRARLAVPLERQEPLRGYPDRGLRLDGTIFELEVHTASIDWDGKLSVVVVVRDVSERRRAEASNATMAEQNRRLLETFPDGIVVHRNGINVFVNPAAVKLRGAKSIDEVQGRDFREIVHPEMHGTIFGRIREAMATGKELPPIEVRASRIDGSELYVEARSTPLQWNGERSILTVLRDLTERKRAEAAAAEIAEQNRRLLETLPDGVVIHSGGAVAYANPTMVRMFKAASPADLIGKEWLPHMAPAIRDIAAARIRAMVATKTSFTPIECQILCFDGTLLDVEARPTYIEWQGQPSVLVVFRDLTERRRAEAKLRETDRRFEAIAASIPGAVYQRVLYPDGRVEFPYMSEGISKTHGITAAEAMADGARMLSLLHPDDRSMVDECMRNSARGLTPLDFELRVLRPNGRTLWMRSISRPQRRDDGATVWDGIFIDVTQRKNVEAALREAKDAAELANRSKSQFLATVSHELRTPLNAIIGFSEILKQEMFGPLGNGAYLTYAHDIFDSGRHLLQLINDILDLAKIEAGKLELHLSAIDVGNVVLSSVRMVRRRADEKGIDVQIRIGERVPKVRADERQMKQIMMNLLSNAVKFTPQGGKVVISAATDGREHVLITVADTGIGIAEEHLAKVLTPFGQIDSTLSRQYEGTGLGLPLTKSLVEMHGGTLTLESRVGRGTTVAIRMPAAA
jgi:PAS domain S-box-containing protein